MPKRPYYTHLQTKSDLVTTREETRAGFVELALEKSRRSVPHVVEARSLKVQATQAKNPKELIHIPQIQRGLLSAAGVSDKAAKYLDEEYKIRAVNGLIEQYLEPAGSAFVEELVYRYLLAKGDTLGGSMRNVGGVLAKKKFAMAIISTLKLAGIEYEWFDNKEKNWSCSPLGDSGIIEENVCGLSWNAQKKRTLLFNITPKFIGNNIDLCLFNGDQSILPGAITRPDRYIALGELKGGIDPAGADEHWKTARSALGRIRTVFSSHDMSPHTFFIGASIVNKMAGEIWQQLEGGSLENAANLTNSNQLASIAAWLCDL